MCTHSPIEGLSWVLSPGAWLWLLRHPFLVLITMGLNYCATSCLLSAFLLDFGKQEIHLLLHCLPIAQSSCLA